MKKTSVFIDANNWYHNVKWWFKPGDIDIKKAVDLICGSIFQFMENNNAEYFDIIKKKIVRGNEVRKK